MFKVSALLFVLVFAGCATASHSIDRLPASSSGGDVGDRGNRDFPAENLLQDFVEKYQAVCSDGYARVSTWRGDAKVVMGGVTWAGGGLGHEFKRITPAKYSVLQATKLDNGEVYSYEVRATAYTASQVRLEARLEITDAAGRKTSVSGFSSMGKSEIGKKSLSFGDKQIEVAINGPVPDSILDTADDGRAMIKALNLKDGDEVQETIYCSILSK